MPAWVLSEYWQYDPVGNYLDPPLLGFRLVEGRYGPIPATAQAGGMLTVRSEVLGLEMHLTPGAPVREALHFYDPLRGEYLRTYREADQARLEEAEERLDAYRRGASAPGSRSAPAERTDGASGAGGRASGAAAARVLRRNERNSTHVPLRRQKAAISAATVPPFPPKPAKPPFLVGRLSRTPFRPATTRIQSLQISAYRKLGHPQSGNQILVALSGPKAT